MEYNPINISYLAPFLLTFTEIKILIQIKIHCNYLCVRMNLAELVFTIFVLYLLYKLIYNVIVPVAKVTTTVRDRMQEEQMRGQQTYQQQPQRNTTASKRTDSTTTTDGEYIDYEEVK